MASHDRSDDHGPPSEVDSGDTYAVREVARIFDVPESRLRYWSQTGFIAPSVRDSGRGLYSFKDLIAIKVAKGLLDAGLPLQRVRKSLGALRAHLPRVQEPLARLRIRCDNDRVIVGDGDRTFDATTGQLLLDFEVDTLREQVATVLALPWVDRQASAETPPQSAYDWFLRGRALESAWSGDLQDPTLAEAIDSYERALALDSSLAAAATNLGSLLAERGEIDRARDAFDLALAHDPEQPEAQFNLAELALRDGDPQTAVSGFRALLRAQPDYLEAHYGLARALLVLERRPQALAHLQRFCQGVAALPRPARSDDLEERYACALEAIESLRDELASR